MPTLGPGVLKIGLVGTEIDASCLVNNVRLTADKTAADPKTMLCGTQKAGAVTYAAKLTGNLDVDSGIDDGLFALSWAEPGSEQEFTFTPSTASGTSAKGTLVVDPLDLGADNYGDDLSSDFEFSVVGDVTFTYPTGALVVMSLGRQAPKAAAGTPAPPATDSAATGSATPPAAQVATPEPVAAEPVPAA